MLSVSPATTARGFTLIELMVAVAVIAILAAVAMPAYTSYVNKSRARSAASDLATLALNLDNSYQLQLSYPTIAADTAASSTLFPAWKPSVGDSFNFSVTSSATAYALKATGIGPASGCTLTLTQAGVKSATSSCGFTTW